MQDNENQLIDKIHCPIPVLPGNRAFSPKARKMEENLFDDHLPLVPRVLLFGKRRVLVPLLKSVRQEWQGQLPSCQTCLPTGREGRS